MLDFLTSVAAPALGGMAGAMLGWYLGRWQQQRVFFYQKKVEAYASLTASLFKFREYCAPAVASLQSFTEVHDAFVRTMDAVCLASLYMPDPLIKDIFKRARPTTDWINGHDEFFQAFHHLHGSDLSVARKEEQFRPLLAAAFGGRAELPGPYKALYDSLFAIIDMLRADMGVEKLGGSFYGGN